MSTNQAVEQLGVVIVTFHPQWHLIEKLLASLPEEASKVIVDNNSGGDSMSQLARLADSRPMVSIIRNTVNLGLPAAINQGAKLLSSPNLNCKYLLLLDQDTEPNLEGVEMLLRWYQRLSNAGSQPGCIGPALIDAQTGLQHGFHRIDGCRWVRYFLDGTDAPVECDNLNCSGTLMSAALFAQLGGMEEDLFIDHLDTEWAFRVKAAGLHLYGIPSVRFIHFMGQSSWRIWLGRWRIWPYRAPQRHFFLFRNALWLMRRDYVPRVWKFWAVVKLVLTAGVHLLFDKQRWAQLRSMRRGVAAGFHAGGKVDNSSSRFL